MSDKVDPQVVKSFCQRSLYFLCKEFLQYKDWDIVHDDLEKFLRGPSAKKALLLPRGHLKTSIVTTGWTIRALLNNPNIRVLIANQIWDKARDMLTEIKEHLESKSPLRYLFGEFKSERWNADAIVIRQRTKALKEPTISTTGVEAETTGGHYDLIILDDLMGLQNCQTPEQRAKVKRFRRSMIDLLEPKGQLIEIGTRWHLDDTFSEILEKEKEYYAIMVRKVVENGKCIFPKKFNMKFNPVTKQFEPTERVCMDFIDHLRRTHTTEEFASQYLNEPIDPENQVFQQSMFKYWQKRPDGLYVGMAVDLAIAESATSDKTAIVVCGMDKDWNLYILDYLTGRWKPSEIVDNIFKVQATWKPFTAGIEVNGFQRTIKLAVEDEMRNRRQFFGIEEIRNGPEKSKENRIKSLEPFYRQGRVHHAEWMRGKDLEVELTTFPKGKHDDIIDAVAMCLPLMSPGQEKPKDDFAPGTYGYVLREAQRYHSRASGWWNF